MQCYSGEMESIPLGFDWLPLIYEQINGQPSEEPYSLNSLSTYLVSKTTLIIQKKLH